MLCPLICVAVGAGRLLELYLYRTPQNIPRVLEFEDSEANILFMPFGERTYFESLLFSLMFIVHLLQMTGKCNIFLDIEENLVLSF